MNLIFKVLVLISVTFNGYTVFSKGNNELELKQIQFVFKSGNKTKSIPHSRSNFLIAFVGSNRNTKKLIEHINSEFNLKKIKGRRVLLSSYKQLNQIGDEDLIVFTSGVRLSTDDLESKLLSVNYVVLKESLPYGLRFFNSDNLLLEANHLKLKIENKQNQELFENASDIIDEQIDSLRGKDRDLNVKSETIESQFFEIIQKAGIIEFQKSVIIFGIICFVIISILLFLVFSINKKRKLHLIDLGEKNRSIMDSLTYAKHIQNAILPDSIFFSSSFKEHFVFYEPKDIVSGDFYWTEEHQNNVYFAVADCTGHGVPGGFLSMICSRSLSKTIKEDGITEPAQILDAVSLDLITFFSKNEKKVQDGMDISLICLNRITDTITFSGAFNSLVYIKNGELNSISGDRRSVGVFGGNKAFTQQVISKNNVNSLYLFSDGYSDQFGGPKYKKFSKNRLRKLLVEIEPLSMKEQYIEVQRNFLDWRGDAEQIDDVTLVGFKL